MRKTPAPTASDDPALRAASRFGLQLRALKPAVRDALAAMQLEAEQAACEIETLKERLLAAEALADRDALIPVLNRRAFLAALQRTAALIGRYGGEAAVIYFDLDDFKALNDGFGHAVGDAALRHFARLLMENVRETDTVGRLGGDEFGVILLHVGKEEARRKAAAMGEAVARSPMIYEGVEHQIRASIGVHAVAMGEPAEDALARADEAMYASKRAGKLARAVMR